MQDNDLCPFLCCRIVEAGYNLGPDGLFYALERVSIFNKNFFNPALVLFITTYNYFSKLFSNILDKGFDKQ